MPKKKKTVDKPPREVKAFVTQNVGCPVCGKTGPHKKLKPRLYIEKDYDLDMCPRTVKWSVSGVDNYVPRHHYMWHCTNCSFTAGHPFFAEPLKGSTFSPNQFAKKFNELPQENKQFSAVTEMLRYRGDYETLSFIDGFKLHLLALYQLYQFEELRTADAVHLGRYALRTAWMYRDLEQDDKLSAEFKTQLESCVNKLVPLWEDVPTSEEDGLRKAIVFYSTTLTGSHALDSARAEVELLLLIARLYMKLNDVQAVRKHIELAKNKSRQFSQENKEAIKQAAEADKPLSGEECFQMSSEERKVSTMLDNVGRVFEDIKEAWEAEQIERAEKIISQNLGKATDKLRELMLRADVDEGITNKMIKRQQARAAKKKGLFGKIFS